MQKICQKCKQLFECNMDKITECHCYSVILSETDSHNIKAIFEDCLCNKCLYLIVEKTEKI